MTKQFDWPAIRAGYERGMSPTEIAKTIPESPSRQAIEKRAKREGWEVAKLPDQAPGTELTGKDATKAVVLQKIRSGVPLGVAAKAAGIHDNTLRNWRNDDVAFGEAVQAARAAFIARKIEQVDEAGERDWKAAAYVLERSPETRDQYGHKQDSGGVTVVLNINRKEGITIEGHRVSESLASPDVHEREYADTSEQIAEA